MNNEDTIELLKTRYQYDWTDIEVHMQEREIGNGSQFALQVFPVDSDTLLWESAWYKSEAFDAYLKGLQDWLLITRQSEKERGHD